MEPKTRPLTPKTRPLTPKTRPLTPKTRPYTHKTRPLKVNNEFIKINYVYRFNSSELHFNELIYFLTIYLLAKPNWLIEHLTMLHISHAFFFLLILMRTHILLLEVMQE